MAARNPHCHYCNQLAGDKEISLNASGLSFQGNMDLRKEASAWLRKNYKRITSPAGKGGLGMRKLPKGQHQSLYQKTPMTLLGFSEKVLKGTDYGYMTAILYLSPGKESGINTCAWATAGCEGGCLGHDAGQMGTPGALAKRLRRTYLWKGNPKLFHALLKSEIESFVENSRYQGFTPVIRLDGATDLGFGKKYARMFPDVQFMDYTKSPKRMRDFLDRKPSHPSNWHITFSWSGSPRHDNEAQALRFMQRGGGVAVVFNVDPGRKAFDPGHRMHRRREPLPALFHGYPVVDADLTDLRFLDKEWFGVPEGLGYCAGLRFKTRRTREVGLAKAAGSDGEEFVVDPRGPRVKHRWKEAGADYVDDDYWCAPGTYPVNPEAHSKKGRHMPRAKNPHHRSIQDYWDERDEAARREQARRQKEIDKSWECPCGGRYPGGGGDPRRPVCSCKRENPQLMVLGGNPPGVDPRAMEALHRYKEDMAAGHFDAAEYWRGQAGAYFTNPPTPIPMEGRRAIHEWSRAVKKAYAARGMTWSSANDQAVKQLAKISDDYDLRWVWKHMDTLIVAASYVSEPLFELGMDLQEHYLLQLMEFYPSPTPPGDQLLAQSAHMAMDRPEHYTLPPHPRGPKGPPHLNPSPLKCDYCGEHRSDVAPRTDEYGADRKVCGKCDASAFESLPLATNPRPPRMHPKERKKRSRAAKRSPAVRAAASERRKKAARKPAARQAAAARRELERASEAGDPSAQKALAKLKKEGGKVVEVTISVTIDGTNEVVHDTVGVVVAKRWQPSAASAKKILNQAIPLSSFPGSVEVTVAFPTALYSWRLTRSGLKLLKRP